MELVRYVDGPWITFCYSNPPEFIRWNGGVTFTYGSFSNGTWYDTGVRTGDCSKDAYTYEEAREFANRMYADVVSDYYDDGAEVVVRD